MTRTQVWLLIGRLMGVTPDKKIEIAPPPPKYVEFSRASGDGNIGFFLYKVHLWTKHNEGKNSFRHFHGGHYWTYNSHEEWSKDIGMGWSRHQMRRIIDRAESTGLVIGWQRSPNKPRWYRIDYDRFEQLLIEAQPDNVVAVSADSVRQIDALTPTFDALRSKFDALTPTFDARLNSFKQPKKQEKEQIRPPVIVRRDPPRFELSKPKTRYELIWDAAYCQLELQFDTRNFERYLSDCRFTGYESGQYVIEVPNQVSADMLTHRLGRVIKRVLSDVAGTESEFRAVVATKREIV